MEIIYLIFVVLLNHWKSILIVSGFILSSITFIRLFLLDKKYCKFYISDINKNQYGSNFGQYWFFIKVIKDDIFDLKIDFIDNKKFSKTNINNKEINEYCEIYEINKGNKIELNIQTFKFEECEIKLSFSDELNNKFTQSIHFCSGNINISKRCWKWYCIKDKFFK